MSTVEGLLNCHGAARAQIVWSFLALLLFTENCLCSYLKHSWINFEFPENELLEFYCCAVTVTCVFISFFLAIFAIRFQWRSIFWVFWTRLLLQTVIHENHRTTRSLLLEELSTKTSLNLAVFCFIYGVEKVTCLMSDVCFECHEADLKMLSEKMLIVSSQTSPNFVVSNEENSLLL